MNVARICLGLILLISANAFAQSSTQQPRVKTKADYAGPLTSANANVKTAQEEWDSTNSKIAAVIASLKKEFESSGAYQDTARELKQAQTDFNATRNAVIEQLRVKPEYVAAKAAKEKAEQKRAAIRPDPSNAEEATAAATAVMQAGAIVSKMEGEAITGDPKCAETQARLVAANARLNELNVQVESSIKDNPDLNKARKDVENAKRKLDECKKARDVAQANYNAAPYK